MKKTKFILSGVGILISVASVGESFGASPGASPGATQEEPSNWVFQMRSLERTLVDAYPYFFTESAFRDEKNRKNVDFHLRNFKSSIHDLPVKAGEGLLGADPLIRGSRARMELLLDRSIKSYTEKDFAVSQASVQSAIYQCVACHTAQGRGKRSTKINDEMFRIHTPTIQKVTSLIAIRQFEGALKAIEFAIQGKMKFQDSSEQMSVLPKVHLLLSLRAMDDEDRALKMLTLLQTKGSKNVNDAAKKKAAQWTSDLLQWRQFLGKTSPEKSSVEKLRWLDQKTSRAGMDADAAYVVLLLRSSVLHGTLVNDLKPESFAKSYEDLAETYQKLGLPFLKELTHLYFDSCAKLPATEAGKRCITKLAEKI